MRYMTWGRRSGVNDSDLVDGNVTNETEMFLGFNLGSRAKHKFNHDML